MAEEQTPERQFGVQRVYTKDISFETPTSPMVFTKEWKPEIEVHMDTAMHDLGQENYEVVLTVTVSAKLGEETAYLAEVKQGGIFRITGFEERERNIMFGVHAPTILFPFAREVVTDLIQRGSFPQFILQPVNFEAHFRQHVEQQQKASH